MFLPNIAKYVFCSCLFCGIVPVYVKSSAFMLIFASHVKEHTTESIMQNQRTLRLHSLEYSWQTNSTNGRSVEWGLSVPGIFSPVTTSTQKKKLLSRWTPCNESSCYTLLLSIRDLSSAIETLRAKVWRNRKLPSVCSVHRWRPVVGWPKLRCKNNAQLRISFGCQRLKLVNLVGWRRAISCKICLDDVLCVIEQAVIR